MSDVHKDHHFRERSTSQPPPSVHGDVSSLGMKHSSEHSRDRSSSYDSSLEKSAVRRMDWTVLPVVTMFYFLSFLDRANIGNARVAGLQTSLQLTDYQYQVAVTVLYAPYIASELPGNLLLRKIGPKLLMPTLLTSWGIVVTLQGLVNSYGSLVAVRAILGLLEGPMFPGIVLYLSGFYTRKELGLRIALFFSAASLSGAFSGLLAAAIENMDGIGGKAGWSWIFILEGLFSVIMGVIGFFVLPSTPKDSKYLTEAQKDNIELRLKHDRPTATVHDRFSYIEVLRSMSSPHVIIVFIMFFCSGTNLYGLALFSPSIIRQLGFSPIKSQLLSVGPFGAGFLLTLISAYASDRYRSRGLVAAFVSMFALIGYSVFLTSKDKYVAYGSLYLSIPGVYAAAPIISAWMANNSEPHYRRATSVAMGFIATNSGGILSTWRFPTNEGPRFTKTAIMNIVFSGTIIVGSLLNILLLTRKNKQKETHRDQILAPFHGKESGEDDASTRAWLELGDRHPGFRYAY